MRYCQVFCIGFSHYPLLQFRISLVLGILTSGRKVRRLSVGSRLRQMRQRKRLTQSQLADRVQVSSQVISNWERGYTTPTADDVARLAEALDTSSDYLLGRTENPDTNQATVDPELEELWERVREKGMEIEVKGFLQRAASSEVTKEQLRDLLKVFQHIADREKK
jgi:transcriptional regulator with XRE-family HTH domain